MVNGVKLSHRLSRLFQPSSILPKDALVKNQNLTSKSQKLMMEMGLIRPSHAGSYHFLPLGVKSLEKLTKLVDVEMKNIGGQKVIFPTLTRTELWRKTGRFDSVSSELFQVKDRHDNDYILSPTYEEAATELVSTLSQLSYKQLPILLYQISEKYRDEMKPRFGLLRGKQFLMKDLYSFDVDLENATRTYEKIGESYVRIFTEIGVDFVKVSGSSGIMGGDLSHEYHYKADIGEDTLIKCNKCDTFTNSELAIDEKCANCGSPDVEKSLGIEVGHTFLLGDKYSKPLGAKYLDRNMKGRCLQMGSYGLGLSRIIGAVLEVKSTENEMRWPRVLAPFSILIIPPKSGSKEELSLKEPNAIERLYNELQSIPELTDEVLVDDRTDLTIGRRFLEAKKFGHPFIIVLGGKMLQNPPLYEVNDVNNSQQLYLDENCLFDFVRKRVVCDHSSVSSSIASSESS